MPIGEPALEENTFDSIYVKSFSSSIYNSDNSFGELLSMQNSISRRARRRLARVNKSTSSPVSSLAAQSDSNSLIKLPRFMSRPAGCSFLGTKAVMAKAKLSNSEIHDTDIIIDSGSDIPLISSECLKNLVSKPKVKTGQKINLVQVTGSATINGYVDIPIYFTTSEGNVLLEVEAYVVKGMSTPFILGNDFADQYQLSIMRKEGHTKLILGESNREINADNSTSGGMYDLNGSTFKISVKKPSTGENFKQLLVRYKRKISEKRRRRARDPFLRAAKDVVIPP